ncbi:hypothetical protein D3C80_1685710 [compost metagenome]
MGRAAKAAEQAGAAEQEHPGADRAKALGAGYGLGQPAFQPRQRQVIGARSAWYQQQVNVTGQLLQAEVSHHLQATGAADLAFALCQGKQAVTALCWQEAVGQGERVHWARHVEHQHIIEQDHCHGFVSMRLLHNPYTS